MPATAQENLPPAWRWTGYSFRVMNTKVQTWLYSQTGSEVLVDVQHLFNSVEKRLSRFNPQSELSRFNACQAPAFKASSLLLDAVEVALWGAEVTGGLYDPTILNALKQAGYDRSFEQVQHPAPLHAVPPPAPNGHALPAAAVRLSPVTFRSVQTNRPAREIYKPVGVGLDLGGMGKGWTVDRAADRLQGLEPFLINAGGDIFGYHAPPGKKGWEIDIIHPFNPDRFIARVHLHHQALATSTIARRRWRQNGRLMHHLIDPRTGRPAQTDALSVTVLAHRTVAAEIFAKVVLILGAEQGLAFLQSRPGLEGLVFTESSEILFTPGLAKLLDRLEPAGYTV